MLLEIKSIIDNCLSEVELSLDNAEDQPITNMISIPVRDVDDNLYTEVDLLKIIRYIESFYKSKLENNTMYFYCWYDAMAGLLRASAVFYSEVITLPFSCKIKIKNTMFSVVEDAHSDISSLYSPTGVLEVYGSYL